MRLLLLASLGLLLGCAIPHQNQRYSNSAEEQGDRRVSQYLSSSWSFETASYWIEGPEGLILIDTQFLPSATRKGIAFVEKATGKKVKLAIVLHPSPDRFNGTAYLRELGVPVVTSEQVRERIPESHAKWAPAFFEKYRAGRYPSNLVLPDSFGNSTTELSAAGLTVKAHVLGAGCSPAHVVVEWEGHLFVGDLVTNGTHGWFENGRTDAWLQRLDELRAMHPKWIHPGRGFTGGPELLDKQTEYVNTVIGAVAAEHPRGVSTPEAQARIKERVNQHYPNHQYPDFLPMLLREEWAHQAAQLAASK